jgi:hypothetical protein
MKALSAGMVAILVTALSMTVHAGDTKFYPGTMCQGTVGQAAFRPVTIGTSTTYSLDTWYLPAIYSFSGAAYNYAQDQDMQMVCPLVRDSDRTDGVGWNSLVITALNLNSSRNLTCTAQTFYSNDYAFGSASSATLGPLTDWTDLSLSALSVPFNGYMVIYCSVPLRDGNYPSGIASYRIDE